MDEFKRGAVIALSTLHGLHDEPTICSEAMEAMDITKADTKGMDLTEYDAQNVKEIFAASRSVIRTPDHE
jgi:hypothetical protein